MLVMNHIPETAKNTKRNMPESVAFLKAGSIIHAHIYIKHSIFTHNVLLNFFSLYIFSSSFHVLPDKMLNNVRKILFDKVSIHQFPPISFTVFE